MQHKAEAAGEVKRPGGLYLRAGRDRREHCLQHCVVSRQPHPAELQVGQAVQNLDSQKALAVDLRHYATARP